MRRSDREIRDRNDMIEVMKRCDICRLAFHDEEYPYIIPLNFGMRVKEGQIVLYFHGALEGKKYELMAKDNRAGFEMDCSHELIMEEVEGNCTMNYECVMGHGRVEMVPEEEKYEALRILMEHYHQEDFPFNRAVMPQTAVFRLKVEEMTGKRRAKAVKPDGNVNG
jgi:Predicted flavin-nucleotide-binding protein